MMDGINQRQQKVDDLTFRLEKAERKILENDRRQWERAAAAVRHYDARRILAGIRRDLVSHTSSLAATMRAGLLRHRARLDQLEHQLKALSPTAILERGYALVFDASGNLVKRSAQVQPGEQISARLGEGALIARVEAKK
jgi:exodeoxyribonuclease VII large subunit